MLCSDAGRVLRVVGRLEPRSQQTATVEHETGAGDEPDGHGDDEAGDRTTIRTPAPMLTPVASDDGDHGRPSPRRTSTTSTELATTTCTPGASGASAWRFTAQLTVTPTVDGPLATVTTGVRHASPCASISARATSVARSAIAPSDTCDAARAA